MKTLKIAGLLCLLCVVFYCCQKVEEGFFSDKIFYRANPFVATQAGVTYSRPLEVDGSTQPIKVKLLSIRNKATGKPADDLLKEREVQVFAGELTAADSTLALLQSKITKKMVKPFNVNEIGGRLEVSQASEFVDIGTYVIDIEVSNMKGSKVINDACEIQLGPKKHYELIGSNATTSDAPPLPEGGFVQVPGGAPVTFERVPNGPDKIIIMFIDMNGKPFNPKAGQVIIRGDRPHFAPMDPFYPEEKTDTALVFQYPITPFPFIRGAYNDFNNYYRIPASANSLGKHINPTFQFRVYSRGTWIIRVKMLTAAKL